MPKTRTADGRVPEGWPVDVVDEVVALRVAAVTERVERLERRILWPAWIAAGAAVLVAVLVVVLTIRGWDDGEVTRDLAAAVARLRDALQGR